jgi:hypothetical protein
MPMPVSDIYIYTGQSAEKKAGKGRKVTQEGKNKIDNLKVVPSQFSTWRIIMQNWNFLLQAIALHCTMTLNIIYM